MFSGVASLSWVNLAILVFISLIAIQFLGLSQFVGGV